MNSLVASCRNKNFYWSLTVKDNSGIVTAAITWDGEERHKMLTSPPLETEEDLLKFIKDSVAIMGKANTKAE